MSHYSGDDRQSGQESDAIEATRFFGEVDMSSSSAHSRCCVYYSYQGNCKTQGCNPNKFILQGLGTAKIISFPTFTVQQCNIIQENIKLK
jgi:hypothetical protein